MKKTSSNLRTPKRDPSRASGDTAVSAVSSRTRTKRTAKMAVAHASSANLKSQISNLKSPRPTRLAAIQRLAFTAITRPLTADFDMQQRWSDGRDTASVVETFIKPNDRLSSFERLEIYNRQYWYRLIDVMYDDYPGVAAILGDRAFHALIKPYLAAHPSRSPLLRNLGTQLPAFIEAHPDLAGPPGAVAARPRAAARTTLAVSRPSPSPRAASAARAQPDSPAPLTPRCEMVLHMARFERAQVDAFDAPSDEPISARDFLRVDPTQLRVSLQPHVFLLELAYPLDDFLLAVKKDATTRGDASNAVDKLHAHKKRTVPLPRRKLTHLAVHRSDNQLFYKRLAPAEYRLLCLLRDGQTLDAACTAIVSESPNDAGWPDRLRDWFKSWTHLGWLCKRR